MERDYSTISPSARSLLLLKGITNIPFARAAAALMTAPEPYVPDATAKDAIFWGRVLHFEARYASINQLLSELPVRNILEISSGFSFRGLDMTSKDNIHYIDTDLPGIIDIKKQMITALASNKPTNNSLLEIIPLNGLDEKQFFDIANRFDNGPIAIVNEGLLMYLDNGEKERLCQIIQAVLKQHGGYWITADIYTKTNPNIENLIKNDELNQFLVAHHVAEKKFDNFEQATDFFERMGFVIDKVASTDYQTLSTYKHFISSLSEEQLSKLKQSEKMWETWRLKLADG